MRYKKLMPKIFLYTMIIFCLTVSIKAEVNTPLPEITVSDIASCEITRKDYFDSKTLWGYIDGGADIYLEYGFDKVVVEELNWQKQHFKVEVYQMQNSQAAFGIYSISKANCALKDSLPEFSCVTSYQTVIFENNLFISIINDTGTWEAEQLSITLSKVLLSKIKTEEFHLPEIFNLPEFNKFKKDAKFFHGELGLQNSLPEMADQFENFKDYSIYFLPVDKQEGYLNLFLIRFSDENDLKGFYLQTAVKPSGEKSAEYEGKDGLYKRAVILNPKTVIYIETNLNKENRNTFINAIDNLVK